VTTSLQSWSSLLSRKVQSSSTKHSKAFHKFRYEDKKTVVVQIMDLCKAKSLRHQSYTMTKLNIWYTVP
jgi:hypothetical protein